MSDWSTGSVVIAHDVGLHARPAVKLTKLAKTFVAAIEVASNAEGPWIDAKSIVKVMAMKAKRHSTLYIRARGAGAERAIATLIDLVAGDFAESTADAGGA